MMQCTGVHTTSDGLETSANRPLTQRIVHDQEDHNNTSTALGVAKLCGNFGERLPRIDQVRTSACTKTRQSHRGSA